MKLFRGIRQRIKARGRWEHMQTTPAWDCYEHTRTGDRKAIWCGGVYAPVPLEFLREATGRAWVYGPFDTKQVKAVDNDEA